MTAPVYLSSEEESALLELSDNRTDEESVKKFIEHRLYYELSCSNGKDEFGEENRTHLPGYHEQKQVYESLVEKGLLVGHRPANAPFYWYGDLTSEGRCYFIDKEAREKAEESRVKSDRAHDLRIALLGIVGGLFSGALGSWLFDIVKGAIARL